MKYKNTQIIYHNIFYTLFFTFRLLVAIVIRRFSPYLRLIICYWLLSSYLTTQFLGLSFFSSLFVFEEISGYTIFNTYNIKTLKDEFLIVFEILDLEYTRARSCQKLQPIVLTTEVFELDSMIGDNALSNDHGLLLIEVRDCFLTIFEELETQNWHFRTLGPKFNNAFWALTKLQRHWHKLIALEKANPNLCYTFHESIETYNFCIDYLDLILFELKLYPWTASGLK